MEIFFCEKCSARLSNTDIQRGDAVMIGEAVYCYHCVPEGIDPDSVPKPAKRPSSFNLPSVQKRTASGTARRPSGVVSTGRRPSSSRLAPESDRAGAPAPAMTPATVVFLAAVMGAALAAAAFVAMRLLG